MGKQWKQWLILFFWAPKSLQMVSAVMKLKDTPLQEIYDQPRQHIKKQKHYFANKGLSSQDYGFSRGHVWMWDLDYKKGWVPKNWCVWTVVLEKTLESPLDCKEIQPVHLKDQSWVFIGGTDIKAETPILWPPDVKSWLIWKDPDAEEDWGKEEKGTTEYEMVQWHHRQNGHGFGWTPAAGDGQWGLAAVIHGIAKDQTWLSDWTERSWERVKNMLSQGGGEGKKKCLFLAWWSLLCFFWSSRTCVPKGLLFPHLLPREDSEQNLERVGWMLGYYLPTNPCEQPPKGRWP